MIAQPPTTTSTGPVSRLKRWAPLVILAVAMGIVFAMGWHKYLSFETVGANYATLKVLIAENYVLAIAAYFVAYVAVVALSLPGGLIMTISGGLLFGWLTAIPVIVIAATFGATFVFLVARSSLGGALGAKSAPWLGKLQDGFRENALSYLLFLRLVPIFPFVVVNLAPALLGVPLSTFVIGTILGIIPGTSAFAVAGAGLGSVVEAQNEIYANCLARAAADANVVCTYAIDTRALVTPELLAAFVGLGIVALIPVVAKAWSKRYAAH